MIRGMKLFTLAVSGFSEMLQATGIARGNLAVNLRELIGHATVNVETSTKEGLFRRITIGAYPVYMRAPSALARIDDEVKDGRVFIRLRSAFDVVSAPTIRDKSQATAKVTQDIWIGADDFLIYKIIEQAEREPAPPERIEIRLSGFNESDLPGPLPE